MTGSTLTNRRPVASTEQQSQEEKNVEENIKVEKQIAKGNSAFKSTWRDNPNVEKDWVMKAIDLLNMWPLADNPPKVDATAPVPYLAPWTLWRWGMVRCAVPFVLQYAISYLFNDILYKGRKSPVSQAGLSPLLAVPFYMAGYYFIGWSCIRVNRFLGANHGYFDGEVPRDEVPDSMRSHVAMSLVVGVAQRSFMNVALTWEADSKPYVRWQLPIQMCVYAWTLDFYFYWYHRIMHESESLWCYHRRHHLTRHPNTTLTLFADEEQELFDAVGIPILTWLTMYPFEFLRPRFYEWWFCLSMVTVVEVFGHSGVRMYFTAPQAFPFLLQKLGMDITLEDHDIHHRSSYRGRGGNYGKQTRIWDRVFGTVEDRVEGPNENIDKNLPVNLPL